MNKPYTVVIPSNSHFNSDITCTRFPEYTYDDSPRDVSLFESINDGLPRNQALVSKNEILELFWGARTPTRKSDY